MVFKTLLVVSWFVLPSALVYWALSWFVAFPYANLIAVSAIPAAFVIARAAYTESFVDVVVRRDLLAKDEFVVHTKDLPRYQFVDVFRAIELLGAKYTLIRRLASQHSEPLGTILNHPFSMGDRMPNAPTASPFKVAVETEEFFPLDGFWVFAAQDLAWRVVVRLRPVHENYHFVMLVETASTNEAAAISVIEEIFRTAREQSIYRRQCLELRFDASVDNEGVMERTEMFGIDFMERPKVSVDDLILEPTARAIVERNVVDFHNRRVDLARAGVPRKRGVLLYGPPGTGKTFTCKHIAHRLPSATVIFAVGHTLLHMKSVCNLARMLQPSVLVLEDVDLVFSKRESNPYVTALGTLLDELDGLTEDNEIIFVLTTNAIERVEEAIKERPGRVSQCVNIVPPGPMLRERYFRRLLEPYDTHGLDYAILVELTDGSTQAFIKELVYRSIQIATEQGTPAEKSAIRPLLENFQAAFDEMTSGAGDRGMAIIGFKL